MATLVANLLPNQLQVQAVSLLQSVLQRGKEEDDPIAVVSICAHGMKVLCNNLLYYEASELVKEALHFTSDPRIHKESSLLINVWNEIGNVYRYLHRRKEALGAYNFVEELIENEPLEESERAQSRRVVKRNLGILNREMGDYQKALALLKAASDSEPKDADILHNLAVLYFNLCRYEDAGRYLDRAVQMCPRALRSINRCRYLLSRSQVKLVVGNVDAGLADVKEAYELSPSDNYSFRYAVAANALSFYPQSADGQLFVAECQALIEKAVGEEDYLGSSPESIFCHYSLCLRLLRDGEVAKATRLFAPLWRRAQKGNYDWQIDYIRGWLHYAQHRDEGCWPMLLHAVEKIEMAIPTGSNVEFAPFWMRNTHEFQEFLGTVSLDLVKRGRLDSRELLAVYEFMNGREITTRILGDNTVISAVELFGRCMSNPKVQQWKTKIIFCIESEDEVGLVCFDLRSGTVGLLDLNSINVSELGEIKYRLQRALKEANPADLSRLDKKLSDWEKFSRHVGEAIAGCVQPGDLICFLPGRALSGLPLHLLLMPDGRFLIEWGIVKFAPNFTVLLETGKDRRMKPEDTITVVTVTKAADSETFRSNALKTGQCLIHLIEQHKYASAVSLNEQTADLFAVQSALRESSEILFLCHGTTAGPEKGYGICIASGGLLPPTILSVSEIPEHAQCILKWEDIAKSPSNFVSIACSSGVTELGKGGVRFGLEQTLFSSGTSLIISPQWDVSQECSLLWVQTFYEARAAHGLSIEKAYQSACLAVRKAHSHYYFWGPFIMNGVL